MDSTSMSPADFSAMMGNNCNGFGGTWWIIILFLFMMNGGWNRNGDFGQYATAASQQEILFGQQFQNIDNKIDRIGNGIADATFALNNSIHNAQDVVAGAVVTEGRNMQGQLAAIGADNRLAIANLGAQTDRQTCAITTAIREDGEKTRALIQQNEVQNLRDRVASLEGDARMCGVVRYPMQSAYYAPNPFCNCNCNCG